MAPASNGDAGRMAPVQLTDAEKLAKIERYKYLKQFQWLCQFLDCDGNPHVGMNHRHARAKQRLTEFEEYILALITGRGFGKTRTAAEFVKGRMLNDPRHRVIIVAPDFGAARDICIEGESGLLAVLPPDKIKNWNRSFGELTLTNGAQAKIYGAHSAEDSNKLRGPQSHTVWFEELAHCRHAAEAWDNALMGNRLGKDPRVVVTSTPRPTATIRRLFKRDDTRIIGGSTFENAENLPPSFLKMLTDTYANTRLGAQELEGQLLEDVTGALLTRDKIHCREDVLPTGMTEIVVAVDPPGSHRSGAEAGIVVVGRGTDGLLYVFEDASFLATPEQWSSRCLELFEEYGASFIVAEKNYGGDMVASTLRSAGVAPGTVKLVRADPGKGKKQRATPVVSLYERGRVIHVGPEGALAGLETQWCSWVPPGQEEVDEHGIPSPIPASDYSPDRIDALVWAITHLALQPKKARVRSRYIQ